MRVLVCGGRDFDNHELLRSTLDSLSPRPSLIIHGGSSGADSLAKIWAMNNRILQEEYLANWNEHGRSAGPIRNETMLREGKPDLVIAFPGGRGTQGMCKIAWREKVEVRLVGWQWPSAENLT